MFQSANILHTLSKDEFDERLPEVREKLLKAQHRVKEEKQFATVIVMSGLDGSGKGDAISRLYEWMDTRYLFCNAYAEKPTEEEKLRPPMWRYWRDLPARGQTSVVFGSWYQHPLGEAVKGNFTDDMLERELSVINRFERMLTHENVLLLKFWFTLPEKVQEKRLIAIKRKQVGKRHFLQEWASIENYREAQLAGEKAALHTSTGYAPWLVVPSQDPYYRDLSMAETIEQAMNKRLEFGKPTQTSAPAIVSGKHSSSAVDSIDLTATLKKGEYKKELEHWQSRIAELTDHKHFKKRALICLFQGNDAAGKGGAIRRLTRTLDPRFYKVYPIAAPSEEERLHPYLWRFWTKVPKRGNTAVFDRSWYERVLVERIEGFCSEADWLRAYNEINFFEADLTKSGIILCKFWLSISEEEQLNRFKAREETAYKTYKITEEDWRNRLKWDQYAVAAGDMVDRTSTKAAPWTLVSSENKRYARVQVLKTVCESLEKEMGG